MLVKGGVRDKMERALKVAKTTQMVREVISDDDCSGSDSWGVRLRAVKMVFDRQFKRFIGSALQSLLYC